MIVYTITHYDTGHADLVRIIPELRFEVKAFPSRPHWLYFSLLRSNVGIAQAAQVIARVSEILITFNETSSCSTYFNAVAQKKMP